MAPGLHSPSFTGRIVRICKRLTWFRCGGSCTGTLRRCGRPGPLPSPPAPAYWRGQASTDAPGSCSKTAKGAFSERLSQSPFPRQALPGEAQGVQRGDSTLHPTWGPLALNPFKSPITPQRSRIGCPISFTNGKPEAQRKERNHRRGR